MGNALAAEHFVARDYLVWTKADTIRLAPTQLLAMGVQRRAWERRMGELLLRAPLERWAARRQRQTRLPRR